MVSAEQLSVRYPRTACPALDRASFALERGAVAWLLGPNGSGKSTLGLAASGLVPHVVPALRNGSITTGGFDPAALSTRERAALTAMVPQDPDAGLCTLSVAAELALTLENRAVTPATIRRRVAETIEQFGLTALTDRPLAQLSGGEKQLVNVAAIAICPPELLVLDEPGSYLDDGNRATVLTALHELRRRAPELTMLAIEHRPDGLPLADALYRCSRGRVERLAEPPAPWGDRFPRLPQHGAAQCGDQVLCVDDLAFAWPGRSQRRIFDGLQISVRAGEIVVVRGPNGSGKSTLFKLILGALRPQRGSIESGPIAYVPQNPEHLFVSYRVRDEIGSALGTSEQVASVAAQFGLSELLDRNPYELSAGQKRRLNIAIVAATDAQLVLLDEPTFGLDQEGVVALIGAIDALRGRGCAQLIATHDDRFAHAIAGRTLTVDDRRLVVAA